MYRLKIFSIGKTKEPWLVEAIGEYTRRLLPILSMEWILLKTEKQLSTHLLKEDSYIALDPGGKALNSERFSLWLMDLLEKENSRMTFVIGAAEGLEKSVLNRATAVISFSPLTFTHQLTRLILLEQLYRAFEIAKGSNYHK